MLLTGSWSHLVSGYVVLSFAQPVAFFFFFFFLLFFNLGASSSSWPPREPGTEEAGWFFSYFRASWDFQSPQLLREALARVQSAFLSLPWCLREKECVRVGRAGERERERERDPHPFVACLERVSVSQPSSESLCSSSMDTSGLCMAAALMKGLKTWQWIYLQDPATLFGKDLDRVTWDQVRPGTSQQHSPNALVGIWCSVSQPLYLSAARRARVHFARSAQGIFCRASHCETPPTVCIVDSCL